MNFSAGSVANWRYTPPRTVRALPPLRRKPSGSLRPEPFPEHCDRYQSDFLLDLRGLVLLRDWKMRRCSSSSMSSGKEVVLKPHPTLTLKGIVKRAHSWLQAWCMLVVKRHGDEGRKRTSSGYKAQTNTMPANAGLSIINWLMGLQDYFSHFHFCLHICNIFRSNPHILWS